MEVTIIVLAILAGIIGIAGSILPGLPGPPISWVGLLLLYFWGPEEVQMKVLVIWGIVTVLVTVFDYIIPMYFTKLTGGSKYAERGSMIGLIAGIFLTPVGMILGSFLGAFLGELCWAKKDIADSFVAAVGSFFGFMLGTGLKAVVSAMMLWRIVVLCF